MLIVRYWSTKKLDRLYELARQEAKEAQRPAVHFDQSEKKSTTPSNSPSLTKLPIIPLGVESSLNSMEESPSDMLRLTQEVLDALLRRWIRVEAGQSLRPMPRAYVSSGSDDELSDVDSLDHPTHGYYIEGVTTDWRKPHSQEARIQATQLRKMYSDKQAHVHSDSDGSEDSVIRSRKGHRRKKYHEKAYASGEYDDMPEQGQMDNSTTTPINSRPYSYSTTNTFPGFDAENHWRHTSGSAKPHPTVQTQSRPIPVPQPMGNKLNVNTGAQPERLATSQPGARGIPSSPSTHGPYANGSFSSYYKTPTNGFPPTPSSYTHQQSYYYPPQQQQPQQQQQYRQYTNQPPPNFARTLSDNTLHPSQQQQQYLTPPSQPHRHRSSRNNRTSKGSISSGSGSGSTRSPSPYNRHKDFKRTAMRGILGASAIGGFMDALEAFSII